MDYLTWIENILSRTPLAQLWSLIAQKMAPLQGYGRARAISE